MESTISKRAKSSINIGLAEEQRAKVVEILTHLLADEHVLYIKLRNYHWNVEGMFFQSLHEFFEEQYTALAETIDNIAERIRSLGAYAPGSMADFREMARLNESTHLNGDGELMLQNILADHEMIIQVLRRNVDETIDDHHDAGTADFLTAIMEEHEKTAWMVRSHLKN